MTPGDEAGALKEEAPVDSAQEAHDDPAPAEGDPGAEEVKEAPAKAEAKPKRFGRKKAKAEEASQEAAESEEAAEEASAEAAAEDSAGASKEGKAASEDTGEPEAAEEETSEEVPAARDAGDDSPATAGAWAASVAVLVVLLIVGVVTAGMYWKQASATSATSSDKQAAMNTAQTAVTDLFTIDYKNPGAFAAKLKPIAAGQFLTVVSNASSGFGKLMQQGKVETTGKVQMMGVQQFGGTTAQVAVLAYETVKNSQSPQGSEHPFRMSLSLIKSGSKWMVSNLEFVQ